jgi:hypothetical protein
MAPYMGMLLQNVVDTDDSTSNQSFSSDFGRTKGSYGPHEFGYFWSRWFHFDRTHKVEVDELLQIDHRQLKREIAALENVRGNPMVFKNLTCGLQIPFLAQIIKNAFFVLCQRHPLYAMQSLLIAREKIHGNLHKWWSLRPKEYPNLISLTPYEQVAGQIYFILEDIKKNLLQLPSEQFMIIHYEDLCENPRREVDRFISSINACGEAISWAREKIPEHFCSKNAQKVGDHHFNKLYEAFQQCFTTPLT